MFFAIRPTSSIHYRQNVTSANTHDVSYPPICAARPHLCLFCFVSPSSFSNTNKVRSLRRNSFSEEHLLFEKLLLKRLLTASAIYWKCIRFVRAWLTWRTRGLGDSTAMRWKKRRKRRDREKRKFSASPRPTLSRWKPCWNKAGLVSAGSPQLVVRCRRERSSSFISVFRFLLATPTPGYGIITRFIHQLHLWLILNVMGKLVETFLLSLFLHIVIVWGL